MSLCRIRRDIIEAQEGIPTREGNYLFAGRWEGIQLDDDECDDEFTVELKDEYGNIVAHAMSADIEWDTEEVEGTVVVCPFCRSKEVSESVEWEARSLDPSDRDNKATILEYICRNESCSRSFWA